MATSNHDTQAVQAAHDAWETAFEQADINVAEKLWVQVADVLLVTPLETRHKGFAEVKGALKNVFGLIGQTTIDVSDAFLTVDGDEASITMLYEWSVAEGFILSATERYQRVDGFWKIHSSDATGKLLPLRPNDERAIKRLAAKVREGLLGKNMAEIAEVVAADFTYIDRNGRRTQEWQASAKALEADIVQIDGLQLKSFTLTGDSTCVQYTVTYVDGHTQRGRFTFVGPDWKLAAIHLNRDAELLADVQPNGKHPTNWGRIKVERSP